MYAIGSRSDFAGETNTCKHNIRNYAVAFVWLCIVSESETLAYGLVKTRLCYVGYMRMFTRIGIRIIPVVASAHLHIRIIPPAIENGCFTT